MQIRIIFRTFAAVMTNEQIEERAQAARELFKQGYNCSQSVVGACADAFGISDRDMALKMAASFGGGIGRMRQTCGAACGMFLLEGMRSGSAQPDHEAKMRNYTRVQALANAFKEQNGALNCSELLANGKRPCADMVADAVRLVLRDI